MLDKGNEGHLVPQRINLEDLFLKIAIPISLKIGEYTLKKLLAYPPVLKAIDQTANALPKVEGIKPTLTTWLESQEFKQFLEMVVKGETKIRDTNIISSYITVGNFYVEEDIEETARHVLMTFAQKLLEELYTTEIGLSIHAYREETLHDRTVNEVQESSKFLGAGIEDLKSGISQIKNMLSEKTLDSEGFKEKSFHVRIDESATLLRQGKVLSARTILERLRSEVSNQSPSAELQFRIATNLGACALKLNNFPLAKIELCNALFLKPDDSKALANAAMVELLIGNPEEAARLSGRARQLKQNDPHSTSINILALHKSNMAAAIESLLLGEPWITENVECSVALGQIKHDMGKFKEAEHIFRKALAQDSQKPELYGLLVQSIVVPIQRAFKDNPPLHWKLPEDTVARLKEAEGLVTRAIEILKDQETPKQLYEFFVNRAGLRRFLSHCEKMEADREKLLDEALKDCERVLLEDDLNQGALTNKGLILLEKRKPVEAIQCFEKLLGICEVGDESPSAEIILAQAYYENGELDKAIGILVKVWNPTQGDKSQIHIADLLLKTHSRKQDSKASETILKTIRDSWPDDPDALAVVASQLLREDKASEAIDTLQRALSHANIDQHDQLALELAETYFSQGKYKEAVPHYESISIRDSDQRLLSHYIISLYNSGLLEQASSVAKEIRGSDKAIPVITEIESLVAEYVGDLTFARDLRVQLSQIEPEKVSHRIRLAYIDLRRKDDKSARQWLNEIKFEEIKDDASVLMDVARARMLLGMPDVLQLGYRALRIGSSNPEIHLSFIQMMITRNESDPSLIPPDRVEVDCVVHLRNGKEIRSFTIVNEEQVARTKGEISAGDQLAQKLLGRAKGDRVVLKEGEFEKLSYDIIDIQSKYVYAFQQTVSNFSTLFPDHPALHLVDIKGGDFTKIFAYIDQRHKILSELTGYHREKLWPLGAIAQLLGSSVIELWGAMIGSIGGRLIASRGNEQDHQKELETLSKTDRITLDSTALLTLEYLQLMDKLPQYFKHIYVAQSVADEFHNAIAKRKLDNKEAMTLWKEGDQYVRHEITPDIREKEIQFLERVMSFIQSVAQIVPTKMILKMDKEKFEEYRKLLGESSIASVLVAKERATPLHSDDLGLRLVSKDVWGVEGIWSQTILKSMRDRRHLQKEEYHEAIRKLARANYHFLSIDSDDLLWIMRQSEMKISDELLRLFRLLEDPDCSIDSTVSVLAEFIKKVWLEQLLTYRKSLILDFALKILASKRNEKNVINKFRSALNQKLNLMPMQLQEIMDQIDVQQQYQLRISRLIS